ncbi:TetR/AcrR family transcriptional regulator [[Pseudopropionibacterium] massiliense]|uniref:TetR/AcrR family transcriptional regulator n=1 Tax=[Pseudopropionibacterium] massiliense TaxID=2220000 RepID=UPI0013EF349D|nr:TetR/AcrR family transcriptional regulator [[Pseudopropionibacterium] massiliense]
MPDPITPRGRQGISRERVRPRRDTVRSAILQAAAQHFLEVGYRAAKIEAIAHMAGFTKGAIYSNFSSKQELVLALAAERIADYAGQVEAELSRSSEPAQLLDALVEHMAGEVMEETAWHALVAELAAGAAADPAMRDLCRSIDARLRNVFTTMLTASGLVDTEKQAARAIRSLLAAVHGFALELTVDRKSVSRDDVTRTLRAIATTHVAPHVNASPK